MTLPTSEKLISQGMSRGGAPEVGSVIERRTFAATETEHAGLGHTSRTCDTCGREWIGPQVCGQGTCRGITFTDRAVNVRPMVIESMPSPNRANATALAERQVKVEVQSEADVALLLHLKGQLEQTVQELLVVDGVMHRIMGRIPMDVAALFTEAKSDRQIAERDERMADVNRDIWYALQSTVHFAAETGGDIPSGGAAPFNASLALSCRQVIFEIDRAVQKYKEALKK